ncbi:MAG: hypothetical protein B6240_02430 [Desulfobacteraceae bacterium 4572_87]|nr:MAG: hypothetical protein B6240_02430 [Desulfobacteraceae bacterium 4572_87]
MVIQCESCQTEFNLDESLLKEEGTKVRCARCRHVFTAYPSAPVPTVETVESPDVFEGPGPDTSNKTDAAVPGIEERVEKEQENGAAAALESDLDVIYQDVFSEVDRSAVDEKIGHDHEVKDVFRKASRGEEDLADRPAPVFPSMDSIEEDPPVVNEKDELEEALETASVPQKKSSKRSMVVLIPLLFIVLAVAAAYYVWKADLIPPSVRSLLSGSSENKKPADAGARLLQFGSVGGVFVDTEKSGPLFVIRGMITNKYPQSIRYILIKGSILDNKGIVVVTKTAYAGNTFSEEELKTLPPDEITTAGDNRDGMAKQNLDVATGATIPFMIVFSKLPDDLSEFTVEAVSSSPGS